MKILVLADDDIAARSIGDDPTDVVISCGDIADDTIIRAAQRVGSAPILAVKGNHDSSGPFPNSIVDLHLKMHAVNRIRFGGFAGSWRYKPRGNYLFDQKEVTQLMATFPRVDVFVAHNSPRGVHDRDDDVHFGFDAFVRYIERAKPRIFIHGHQHVNRESRIGETRVIGVYGFRWLEI